MPFSSLKKSSKRSQRHYKERQQPSRRSHLGQLEKHKDYVVRARDYQRKAATLKTLRRRARDKNPDEFYFHMTRSRLIDGQHSEAGAPVAAEKRPNAENKRIRQLLLEDSNYLRHKLQIERSQLAKLEPALASFAGVAGGVGVGGGGGGGGPRVVFDRGDFRRINREAAAAAAAADSPAGTDGPLWSAYLAALDKGSVVRLGRERARSLKAARQRMARAEALSASLAQLEAKRCLASEAGRPRKLMAEASGAAPAVWKFAFKRKR